MYREPIFRATGSNRDERLAAIDEIIARTTRGEPYDDVETSTGTVLEYASAEPSPEERTTFGEYIDEEDA